VKANWRNRGSRAGTSTIPAHDDSPDSVELVAASASSIGPLSAIRDSIAARSSGVGSAACIMPSTNSRSPDSVGIRPAEVCGAASRPSSSRSCMTLRIEAGDRFIRDNFEIVRDPTGAPLSR